MVLYNFFGGGFVGLFFFVVFCLFVRPCFLGFLSESKFYRVICSQVLHILSMGCLL